MSILHARYRSLWLDLFSLFFFHQVKRARQQSFRLYRENRFIRIGSNGYLSAAHKNRKIRFFLRPEKYPWNIVTYARIDVSSRTINDRFDLSPRVDVETAEIFANMDKYKRKNVARWLLLFIVLVIIILCTDPEIRFPGFNGTADLLSRLRSKISIGSSRLCITRNIMIIWTILHNVS